MEKLFLQDEVEIVKNKINTYLLEEKNILYPQLRQILKKPGKLIRACLLILCAKLFGKTNDKILNSAVVIELIHLASLIHDDVLDEGTKRRGEKTINIIWGNRNSILTGDYILSVALNVLSSHVIDSKNLGIIEILSREMKNMCEGEALDTQKNKKVNEEKYIEIVEKKTSSLFCASCEIGAYLGGAGEKEKNYLREFGKNLGIAFQITDDILDFISSEKDTGKASLRDVFCENYTLPLIYSLNVSTKKEKERIENLIANNKSPNKIKEFVIEKGGVDYSRRVALHYRDNAYNNLKYFKDGNVKKSLISILDFSISRNR